METVLFIILIAQFLLIIALCVMNFKDIILNFILGIRRKRAIFIDIRSSIFLTLSDDLKTFEYMGKVFVWNFQKELNGVCFYRTDNSEALDMTIDVDKCRYWCDSNEYHTNLKNKLLETMMMLRNKDTIIMFLIIGIIVGVATIGLVYIQTNAIKESINVVQNTLYVMNQTNNAAIIPNN